MYIPVLFIEKISIPKIFHSLGRDVEEVLSLLVTGLYLEGETFCFALTHGTVKF